MAQQKVTVLGVNGRIGRAVATAFAAAGWDVTGMARSAGGSVPGVRHVSGNSDSLEDLRAAIGDAPVVVNALNMRYHQWDQGRMEAQMARVAAAMGTDGKTMLFPGNIYNYGADLGHVTPDQPQQPQTRRGAIRMRVEQNFRAAAEAGHFQVLIIRAGDFFGPHAKGDWFDEIIFRDRGLQTASLPGRPGIGHSWAYLPDLARAFERVAERRRELGAFENFHFAGNFVTPDELGATIQRVAPAPLKLAFFPFWMLVLAGMFSPLLREVAKMRYLWTYPMQLEDKRLDALLGPGFATPFAVAVGATVAGFYEDRVRYAAKSRPTPSLSQSSSPGLTR